MATKSDFAQKLLHDLRLRKEKMTVTQNSSRHSGQTSRDMHENTGRTNRGSQRVNALEYAGSRTGNMSRRSNKGSRSNSFAESSNQIVLYDKGQTSTQVRDLSMAIAFAFENSGKFNKRTSSSNPLVNFFNRFGRRSMDCRKMDITSFDNHSLSTSQFPNVSNIHISEISKGVQKLNQILRACSNGINFDINSIEVGKELLKGSIDLEESLRMLVNLQEASVYTNGGGAQQKSRIKLLEEDEDYQEDTEKTTDHWQLSRPRFSFDKTSRNSHNVQSAAKNNSKGRQLAISYLDGTPKQPVSNSKIISHKKSASCGQDLSISTQVKLNNNSSSSESTQEKGRLSNVIAKLMGLEELPQMEISTGKQKDSKWKEGKDTNEGKQKISNKTNKLTESLNRDSRKALPLTTDKKLHLTNNTLIKDSKLNLKAEKCHETPDGSCKMVKPEGNKPQKDSKLLETTTMQKQQNQDSESKRDLKVESKKEIIETKERKAPTLNSELVQKAKKRRIPKVEDTPHNRTDRNISANYLEKRITSKDLSSNQQKSPDQRASAQVQVPKKPRHSEDKRRVAQKGQQLKKQNFLNKKQEGKVESIISSNPKKVAAENLEKKISRDKSMLGNGTLTEFTEKVPMKDPANSRNRDDALMVDTSKNSVANQENFKKEDKSQDSSPIKPEFDNEKESSNLLTHDKPIIVSVTRDKAISQKVQKSENPRKIDVLITRRNASATENRLTRSLKQSANMLQELKQQMHNKNCSSKTMELQSDSKVKEGEVSTIMCNASQMSTETLNQSDKLQNEAEHVFTLNSSVEDECQTQNIQRSPTPNDNYDDISDPGKVSNYPQTVEQSYASKDAQELMQCGQSSGHEEPMESLYKIPEHEYMQLTALGRQKQLTEPEKDLKEIVIKSQMFLNTAEALFKLNIPINFLHDSDLNDEVADKKLILDCGYEVIKRKARRYEVTLHPYIKTTVTCTKVRSLDDLVKQLCRDFETLKSYGGNDSDQSDVADSLCKMLDNDINNKDPDVNSMWDFEWNKMKCVFPEKEDVIRDVEKHMLNGLLEEITNDLLLVIEYRNYKPESEEDYDNMYNRRMEYLEGEDGELSWFNAGVRVGVGIGLGVCVGLGIGVGLLVRTYQTTTRTFKRRLL
ncbi:hypothetical protein RD792_000996 [Penstemon davidsonii]|uniref:DUF4378 domain-containing protein n=1 Tax=Penstemon davidsonii TaxID=160366 RepID=A0ABR0DMX4_9LAMI|nr:hypothetical protein RD792_000996 [Penstemon davidsonii]